MGRKNDFDPVREVGLGLPDVKHSVSPRGESLRVRGKLMACHAIHKSAEPNTLMVRVSVADRDRLIAKDPKTYYIRPHYETSPSVLVRLSRIRRGELKQLLGVSWQFVYEQAPKGRARATAKRMSGPKTQDIDAYIARFPGHVQDLLREVRAVIRRAAPDAVEAIKYGIPTFVQGENLVHFAGYRSHIGFYPTSSGIAAFDDKLVRYKRSKGAVQFPLDEPVPAKLIGQIVRFRLREARARAKRPAPGLAAKRGSL